jgi:hypothetical protein
MHELKQKHTVLTLKQNMEIGKRPKMGENCVKIGVLLYNQQININGQYHCPYMLYNGEFTVFC